MSIKQLTLTKLPKYHTRLCHVTGLDAQHENWSEKINEHPTTTKINDY